MDLKIISNIPKQSILNYQYKDLLDLYLHYNIFKFPQVENIPKYTLNPSMLASYLLQQFEPENLIISCSKSFSYEAEQKQHVKIYANKKMIWRAEICKQYSYGISLGEALARLIILTYEE